MYILDRDPDRRLRPWHIHAGEDPYAVFAACGKVFDVRPGVTLSGDAAPSLVCGVCFARVQTVWEVDGKVVRDNTPHVLRTFDRIPAEAVGDALDTRLAMIEGGRWA